MRFTTEAIVAHRGGGCYCHRERDIIKTSLESKLLMAVFNVSISRPRPSVAVTPVLRTSIMTASSSIWLSLVFVEFHKSEIGKTPQEGIKMTKYAHTRVQLSYLLRCAVQTISLDGKESFLFKSAV